MKMSHLITLCAFALAGSGCGKETTVSTPAGDVKVTKKGDATHFEINAGKDGKMNVAASGGEKGVALPDGFPADIPVMPGAVVKLSAAMDGNMSVHFGVKASQADAVKYYEENLKAKGWQIEGSMKTGESAMLSATKGKRGCVLTVVTEPAGGSMVQVMVPKEKT